MSVPDLLGRVALVTGASRGIGAEVAYKLAERGADIVVNYRSKRPRAEEVATSIRALGRRAVLAQADLTDADESTAMFDLVGREYGRLDLLILNASGGLEKDKAEDYALQLNRSAQERAADLSIPLMMQGSRIVFVTSHLAHFYGQKPTFPGYEVVAASKYAGEQALRARVPALTDRGIRLVVVSGDLIEGTITPRLMEREQRGLIEGRRAQVGTLPTIPEFAQAIVDAATDPNVESGTTIFVGSIEWGT